MLRLRVCLLLVFLDQNRKLILIVQGHCYTQPLISILNCFCIYFIIFRVCADKSNPDHLIFIIYLNNESVFIPFYVEYNPILSNYSSIWIFISNLNWWCPIRCFSLLTWNTRSQDTTTYMTKSTPFVYYKPLFKNIKTMRTGASNIGKLEKRWNLTFIHSIFMPFTQCGLRALSDNFK